MRIFNPRISIYSLIKCYIGHESSCEATTGSRVNVQPCVQNNLAKYREYLSVPWMNGSQSHVRCTITYEPAGSWLDVVTVLEAWVTDYGPGLETWHVFHFSVWFMVWGIRKEAKGILKQGKAAPCKAKRYKKAKRGMARPLAGGGVVVGHLATHADLRQYFHLMWKIKFLADSNMIIRIINPEDFNMLS